MKRVGRPSPSANPHPGLRRRRLCGGTASTWASSSLGPLWASGCACCTPWDGAPHPAGRADTAPPLCRAPAVCALVCRLALGVEEPGGECAALPCWSAVLGARPLCLTGRAVVGCSARPAARRSCSNTWRLPRRSEGGAPSAQRHPRGQAAAPAAPQRSSARAPGCCPAGWRACNPVVAWCKRTEAALQGSECRCAGGPNQTHCNCMCSSPAVHAQGRRDTGQGCGQTLKKGEGKETCNLPAASLLRCAIFVPVATTRGAILCCRCCETLC